MKAILLTLAFAAALSLPAAAQTKTNETISRQIKALKSEKVVELTYDQASNVTRIKAVSGNFPDAGKAGVLAMNFAVGFMYQGQEISRAPENILLTFWVLTKKPRFATNHNLLVNDAGGARDLGPARYAAKARQDMEYLNFELSRTDLERIVARPNTSFKLGDSEFTFTREQQKAISDVLTLSDPSK